MTHGLDQIKKLNEAAVRKYEGEAEASRRRTTEAYSAKSPTAGDKDLEYLLAAVDMMLHANGISERSIVAVARMRFGNPMPADKAREILWPVADGDGQ